MRGREWLPPGRCRQVVARAALAATIFLAATTAAAVILATVVVDVVIASDIVGQDAAIASATLVIIIIVIASGSKTIFVNVAAFIGAAFGTFSRLASTPTPALSSGTARHSATCSLPKRISS